MFILWIEGFVRLFPYVRYVRLLFKYWRAHDALLEFSYSVGIIRGVATQGLITVVNEFLGRWGSENNLDWQNDKRGNFSEALSAVWLENVAPSEFSNKVYTCERSAVPAKTYAKCKLE